MGFLKKVSVVSLICALATFFYACSVPAPEDDVIPTYKKSVNASVPYHGGYCVVDGKQIKQYSVAGVFQSVLLESDGLLLDLVTYDTTLLAVGENGFVAYSVDGNSFRNLIISKEVDLLSVTTYRDGYVIGASSGNLYYVTLDEKPNYKCLTTKLNEPIISLSYGNDLLVGVTKSGNILTVNPLNEQKICSITDFYDGTFELVDVVFSGKAHWILGQDSINSLVNVFISDNGAIWNRRILNYLAGEMHYFDPPLVGKAICWDGEQALIACNRGRLIALPDCMQCNTMVTFDGQELLTVASDGNSVFVYGSNGFSQVRQTDASVANNIDRITAQQYLNNGAQLIDVRGTDEFAKDSISQSINIPFADLKKTIQTRYPNREQYLIFTCAVGVRSAAAVKMLKELGYKNVFSIGSYTNWSK